MILSTALYVSWNKFPSTSGTVNCTSMGIIFPVVISFVILYFSLVILSYYKNVNTYNIGAFQENVKKKLLLVSAFCTASGRILKSGAQLYSTFIIRYPTPIWVWIYWGIGTPLSFTRVAIKYPQEAISLSQLHPIPSA